MASSGKMNVADTVRGLTLPVAEEMGLSLWDVEYVREGGENYLRITIDSPSGITVEDTEQLFRKMDKILDEHDPVPDSYCLEVSSPGVERELRRPEHFAAFVGQSVRLRLFKAKDGCKEFIGVLTGAEEGRITLSLPEGEIAFDRAEIAKANAYYDFSKDSEK